MSAAGSGIFTGADGYQASLRDMFDLLVLCPRDFHARLTWVELPHVRLLRAEESSARVAYLRLPREQVFVFFATRQGPPPVHGGEELRFGELLCHGIDGRGHQRTTAGSHWGSIAVTPETLASFGRSIMGGRLLVPSHARMFRPAAGDSRRLLRLHAQASRIAETSPHRIVHPEIVRALDQDLIALLVTCLMTAGLSQDDPARERQARLCVEFEQILGAVPSRVLPTRQVCEALEVSEQWLRASCKRLLGMGPGRYQRLRRLKLARAALRGAGGEPPDVPAILARHGFADLQRFVAEYRQAYGEMPPIPVRSAGRR
ncbi:MAG TPA: helix-turn-helix domain-containing protein [Acetobacteraceae bacterium]